MANLLTFDTSRNLELTSSFPSISSLKSDKTLGYLIARFLQFTLPKKWFCWISRGTIQLQSILRPRKWSYWTKLSDDIYIGAMPLKNWNHIEQITQLGIKAILSTNEAYEFQTQSFADPVRPSDWKTKQVNFLRIATPDLEPIKTSKLAKAVNYVATQVSLGNPVYIHCTGGRARSVSVAICSLIKIKGWTLEESVQYVQRRRPQCMLNQKQINSIIQWHEEFKKSEARSLIPPLQV